MRTIPARAALAVVSAAVVVACTAAGQPSPPAGTAIDCDVTATDPAAATAALEAAVPGGVVCVRGDGLRDADLLVTRSGTRDRPIVLAGDATAVRSVEVAADHVVIQGFLVAGGEGVVVAGGGVTVRDNEVRDAVLDGISCEERCVDVSIESNTVVGTDGSGIIVEGERIAVRGNTVSGSVQRTANDADGIRFFGTGIEITGNTVSDISDDGYAEDPPHTDCFQTYDNSRLPTVGAVISGNVCRNVDHQCLIATAEESGRDDAIGRSRDIRFSDNECDVGGSQAVLVQWIPGVLVTGNTFAGPALDRAAIFLDGSTGAEFSRNVVPAGVAPHQLDETSEEGFRTDVPDED